MGARSTESGRLRIGVSSCLLGEAVRYDGGHKQERVLLERLSAHVSWWPVCPEVALGLGVPRPAIRLEREGPRVHLRAVHGSRDHTEAMARCTRDLVESARSEGICGFVLKSRSPSCGPGDAPLHDARGRQLGVQDGAFAAAVRAGIAELPIVSESGLRSVEGREAFLAAAEAWREFARGASSLRRFHRRWRFVVAARRPSALPELRALRDADASGPYARAFFRAVHRPATHEGHLRVLRMLGELIVRAAPDADARPRAAALDAYDNGAFSLGSAVRVLSEAVQEHGLLALADDAYLRPGPARAPEYESL